MAKEKLYFDEERETVVASTEFAARYFGVTAQTLANWVKSGCPRHDYGYYDLKAVSDYRARLTGIKPDAAEEDVDKMSIAAQKTYYEGKLKQAQLEAAEFRNAINKGEYLERTFVVSSLKAFFIILKRSSQGLGKKLSREIAGYVDPQEGRRLDTLISTTISDALDQMSVEGVYDAKAK